MEHLDRKKMQQAACSMGEVLSIENAFTWYGYFKEALHHSDDFDDILHNAHVCLEYAEKAGIDHCLPAKVKEAAAMWRKDFGAA